jgi:threonine dehydratase
LRRAPPTRDGPDGSIPSMSTPVFLETPLLRRTPLDAELGCELLFKIETLNPIRSFKGRGAELFAATELTAGTPVVCASAGNFGQALAYAATRRGHACTVFTAENASPMKIAAMRRVGAEVRLVGDDFAAGKLSLSAHTSSWSLSSSLSFTCAFHGSVR